MGRRQLYRVEALVAGLLAIGFATGFGFGVALLLETFENDRGDGATAVSTRPEQVVDVRVKPGEDLLRDKRVLRPSVAREGRDTARRRRARERTRRFAPSDAAASRRSAQRATTVRPPAIAPPLRREEATLPSSPAPRVAPPPAPRVAPSPAPRVAPPPAPRVAPPPAPRVVPPRRETVFDDSG